MLDEIYSYRDMCEKENTQTLQRGMNYRINPGYSLILMSRRSNALYKDNIMDDGITIEYEGHDEPKNRGNVNPKEIDQPRYTRTSRLTQNGLFANAVETYKEKHAIPEKVKVYEKIFSGVWSLKGYFDLIDYKYVNDGKRNVFVFVLTLAKDQKEISSVPIDLKHSRMIPSEVKKEVWKRDKGKCVICDSTKNLHFDHDLPFSKGGTSLMAQNIRLLCAKHNLEKSDKIQ